MLVMQPSHQPTARPAPANVAGHWVLASVPQACAGGWLFRPASRWSRTSSRRTTQVLPTWYAGTRPVLQPPIGGLPGDAKHCPQLLDSQVLRIPSKQLLEPLTSTLLASDR